MSTATVPSTPPAAPPVADPAAAVPPAAPPASGSPDFASFVPAEYKDKPYMKDIKDAGGVFKMLDSAQSLIGKPRAPKADAPQAEWDNFFKEFGRPETADKYEFQIPDDQKATRNVEVDNKVKAIFHEAGLNSKQAQLIQTKYDAIVAAETKAESDRLNGEYEKLAKQVFGDKWEESEKIAHKMLAEMTPDAAKPLIQNLPNQHLVLVASILDAVQKKYIGEDPKLPGGGGGGQAPNTEEEKRAKGRELMASEAWNNPFHKDHERVRAEVAAIYPKKS